MPPKVDARTLAGKMENAVTIFYELIEEFEIIFSVRPELKTLEAAFNQVETRYRFIKKQQETILDRLVDEGITAEEEPLLTTKKLGDKVKADFLQIALKFAAYQKEQDSTKTSSKDSETLKTLTASMSSMTSAVTKMADTLRSKPNTSGLQRLPVPTWDGSRRSYATWRKEFNHWMTKYDQDKDEQLQRFRNALPRGSWWSDQVKTCKTIDSAWSILDTEFADKRKLMDELLLEINSLKPVKRDSRSFTHFATTVSSYANDMEDNGCPVLESSEAPFLMSQLLSKLDPNDNSHFGREMKREGKEETVSNLITWLHVEASVRSRGKNNTVSEDRNESRRYRTPSKTENNAASGEEPDDDTCPLNCKTKHHLAACPVFQELAISQRWEIVKQHWRCRKCLRKHHTSNCRKPDGSTCDKCRKNHHRSLHNDKIGETSSSPNPRASSFQSQCQAPSSTSNGSIQENAVHHKEKLKLITGLCPVQKVGVMNGNGEFVEVLAMLDSGSNTSLLSKNAARRLGLSGSATHLTMNLAGGKKKSEASQIIDITVASPADEDIKKTLQVYTVTRPCSKAKTLSKELVRHYPHLKHVCDKLHLSGGAIDLLVGTDFVEAFIDIHTVSGEPGEPVAKRNCFGWYVMGQFEKNNSTTSEIQSVEIRTANVVDDIKELLHQDLLGVKPTNLCTCSENEIRESKFVKSLAASTTLVDGRIQVKMPWTEAGPPKQSNYGIALKRLFSTERSFQKKGCLDVVNEEVQKPLEQDYVIQVSPDQIDHSKPEWYLPLQAEGQYPKFEARAPIEPTAKAGVLMEVKIEKTKTPMQHEAAIAEFQTKVDLDKSEEDTNPVFHQLLNTCSTFSKIRRTLAYVRRFIQNARKKNVKTGSITVQELQGSEKQLFKWSQAHLDPSVIDKKLTPKLDENGLLRAHGRLEDVRSLPQELRNPVILPRDHPLVILLLRDLHERRGHCGYKSLINEARRKYWIIGDRGMSKALTTKCITCRKLRKKPLEQLMGQIPSLRVAVGTPPFFNTAMDMFGPLHIKLNRKTLKEVQVIIFTCMTTRAVHLELVTDKTSDAFLMAFRRFASLRGHPCICWSDCGTNFVGAQGYLKEIMQSWNVPKIEGGLSEDFSCDFKWKWNPPHASHQNGVVETLIKSVRQSLNATCKNQAFTEEQWRTFLAETTYVINGRPLYPSSDRIWESPPITPNDILIGHHLTIPQPEPEERINPRHLLRSTENRVNEFWRCWMRYFAPNLLPRNKWFRTRENLQVDDLVLEIDPNHKRSQWKMARVIATYPGNDGLVRKTRIKTQDGEYDRPIHKLCLLATKDELNANLS
ncbi:uncharacterized protein [Montipora capricornis]|uniref:uncharacterized protein n=1 Tax=Montipora capricornis TaxID=246305 RepID=UPI0035F15A5D